MTTISEDEFSQMSQLLAKLLDACDCAEETTLLQVFERLEGLRAQSTHLQNAKRRLLATRSQTPQ